MTDTDQTSAEVVYAATDAERRLASIWQCEFGSDVLDAIAEHGAVRVDGPHELAWEVLDVLRDAVESICEHERDNAEMDLSGAYPGDGVGDYRTAAGWLAVLELMADR